MKEKIAKEKEELLKNIPKDYQNAAQRQYDALFEEIENMAENDPVFAGQFLLPHKSFQKCYKYMEKKAYDMAPKNAQGLLVDSVTLMEWVREYYALDDKEEAEKREKQVEAEKQVQIKAKKQENKGTPVTYTAPVVSKKKSKTDLEGQIDLFSMFG